MGIVFSDLGVTADGYAAGLQQSEEVPFGDGPEDWFHGWMFHQPDENAAEIEAILGAGATVMGRNMFGPVRGEWDRDWRGWWGPNPPYHGPVYVLTHYSHDPIEMEGGTTFHFVTDGPEMALTLAREAAGDGDISVAGGATTVNQFLELGLIDQLRLHITANVLGGGERVFDGVSARPMERLSVRVASTVTHVTYGPVRS